jgi:tRNA nucleotidyltransferase (CCA-adding enzyme)
MKIYLVGGAVRDMLMDKEPKDRDYVVVGSTHEEMVSLGFGMPCGSAFPVYRHPETKEEYALARTERSTGPGYHDFETLFSPDVTLEQDLLRRDLTINAIAYDEEVGEFIDPHGGIEDIKNKLLRPVNPQAFLEDPLRIYRLARLFARYGGEFQIDCRTMWLVSKAVKAGGLNHLPKERKFAEIEKCFKDYSHSNKPSLMITFLADIGELPEIAALEGIPQPPDHHPEGDAFVHTMLVLDAAFNLGASAKELFAAMLHDVGKAVVYKEFGVLHGHEEAGVPVVHELCDRLGVPGSWRKLAAVCTKHHGHVHKIMEMKPRKVYNLLNLLKAEQDFDTLLSLCLVCQADAWGRGPTKYGKVYKQGSYLMDIACGLAENRKELKQKSKDIAMKFYGREVAGNFSTNHMIAEQIRAEKIAVVRNLILEIKDGYL